MTTTAEPSSGAGVPEDDPLWLSDEQIANLSPEDFELYVRVLEAERLERTRTHQDNGQGVDYSRDPVGWVHDKLGEYLWSKQQEILRAVVDHRRVAVRSCHGIGKTYSMAKLVCWWLDTHPPGTAFVVSTAPTRDQVRDLLWREINAAHAKANLPGRTNQTEWWIGDELVAYGRKPATAGSFVGLHARYVLVIIDEGDAVPASLYTAANSLATNEDSRIVVIGNPDTPTGPFRRAHRPGSGWHTIQIGAFDSPNFTGEYVPDHVKHVLTGPTFVQEIRTDFGETSAEYSSKVLGEFPASAKDGVIPEKAIGDALRQGPAFTDDQVPVELGVDVGGSLGGDRTVIRVRHGLTVGSGEGWRWTVRTDDPEEVVELILRAVHESRATSVKIDSIGIGWGVAGSLRRRLDDLTVRGRQHRVVVHPVNASHAASEPKRFYNQRAELWWNMREWLQAGLVNLGQVQQGDDPDPVVEELLEPTWSRRNGRILLQEKGEIRETLGRSPDDADALLLAFHQPPLVRSSQTVMVEQDRWAGLAARR